MKQRLTPSGLLRYVAALMLIVAFTKANAQVQTARYVSMTPNTHGYYEYLPQGYSSGSQSYPVLIFIHGVGELGSGNSTDLPKVLKNGPPNLISRGVFPTSFTVNGRSFSFIVITPQFVSTPSPNDINTIIDYLKAHYRVDASRIYLTGLSMGGGTTWEYPGYNSTYANKVAAIAPFAGASWPDYNRARTIAASNLPVWAFHNTGDNTVPVSYTQDYIKYINTAPAPNPMAKATYFNATGHNCWSKGYDPNYTEGGLNVYQWMLQYSRGGSSTSGTPATTTYVTLPSKVEAESFASMYGVQDETTTDAGGGQDVGHIDNGDWMSFNVNPSTSGSYTVSFRLATPNANGSFQLKKTDGTVLATVKVPNTGGYQTWTTVTATVNLTAGNQALNIQSTSTDHWNINWLQFATATTATATYVSLPTKVEAEQYASMSGVVPESTTDAGGGQDVGNIDNGEWMNYNVNPLTSGTYTVSFRVATPHANASFQLKKADGTVLATVKVPNTGGYQTWTTVNATVSLTAGNQTIKIQSTSTDRWNINWFQFATGSTTSTSTSTVSTTNLSVAPNPVTDKFTLTVNNNLTGNMNVQIFDLSGNLKKVFYLQKSSTGAVQTYLSIGDLPTGNYVLNVQMPQWYQQIKIAKQ